jgi:alpha-L-arabinofuranosidase
MRTDVVEALKRIKVPNIRWPGGCFADTYHWRDGVGPREQRPSIVNTNWGGVTEDNGIGTHEYLELSKAIGAEPFIVGNVGSGTVQEMHDWWSTSTIRGAARWRIFAARTDTTSRSTFAFGESATKRGAAEATCGPSTMLMS